MQMRADLQIKSVIKALREVIQPAVDADNKLAQEQVRLCIGLLDLVAEQLPLQFRFDCDELARLNRYAEELQRVARGGPETSAALAALQTQAGRAGELLEKAKASPQDIERAVRAMREATGTLVTSVFRDGEPDAQERVQRTTLAISKEQLLRDRAWVRSQGWEPDPAAVPPVTELLEAR